MNNPSPRKAGAYGLLLRSVPAVPFALFVVSVFAMNLLANKSLTLPVDWLALDGGILVSWFAFLSMDMLTKHFGPKAATQLSLTAIGLNLLFCLMLYLASLLPGMWGEAYVPGSEAAINAALDHTFGGTWYVVAGSTAAMAASAVVNNFTNALVGRLLRSDGFAAYACRAYVSTAVGQFVDNLVFALLVSHAFFGWTLTQCLTCAATGMLAELLCECVFSFAGYRVCARWKRLGVGQAYLDLQKGKQA